MDGPGAFMELVVETAPGDPLPDGVTPTPLSSGPGLLCSKRDCSRVSWVLDLNKPLVEGVDLGSTTKYSQCNIFSINILLKV